MPISFKLNNTNIRYFFQTTKFLWVFFLLRCPAFFRTAYVTQSVLLVDGFNLNICCGGWIRTTDPKVMSLVSYLCSTPRCYFVFIYIQIYYKKFNFPKIFVYFFKLNSVGLGRTLFNLLSHPSLPKSCQYQIPHYLILVEMRGIEPLSYKELIIPAYHTFSKFYQNLQIRRVLIIHRHHYFNSILGSVNFPPL